LKDLPYSLGDYPDMPHNGMLHFEKENRIFIEFAGEKSKISVVISIYSKIELLIISNGKLISLAQSQTKNWGDHLGLLKNYGTRNQPWDNYTIL
jgi:hypothetical protein